MSELERLVDVLREYGVVEKAAEVADCIRYVDGVWLLQAEGGQQLRLEEKALPRAVAELLALYAGAVAGGRDERRLAAEWLSGAREADGEKVFGWLSRLGWQGGGGVVVLLEFARDVESGTAEDAVVLLRELIEAEQAVVARQGSRRIWVLVPLEREGAQDAKAAQDAKGAYGGILELKEAVSAWIDALLAELFLMSQAGVSAVRGLLDLPIARAEAEFALEAGKRFRGREAIHEFGKLGIAGLLYGTPANVRNQFVQEILPDEVLEALTPELRETVFAFVEHGQQVADTARAMFLHRNTLLYRLERIHELTGRDPRHPLEGWTLWLALTLLRSGCTNEPGSVCSFCPIAPDAPSRYTGSNS
jgi:hypothetical protein